MQPSMPWLFIIGAALLAHVAVEFVAAFSKMQIPAGLNWIAIIGVGLISASFVL